MANDSYLRRLTGGVVLTSMLGASVVGCALNNPPTTQQDIQSDSIDVIVWRMGSDTTFLEYGGDVFHLWPTPSLEGEDPLSFVNRLGKMMGLEEVRPDVLRKGADLLTPVNENNLTYLSYIIGFEGEPRKIRLYKFPSADTLTPGYYLAPFPTKWNSIKQIQDYYKRN